MSNWGYISGNQDALQLEDTSKFLEDLRSVCSGVDVDVLERKDAHDIIRWDQPFVVARAPGRLDVMGGIADYSGALVLQMPIKEACHVALQRQAPTPGSPAMLRIVSFHADDCHRGPMYEIELHKLCPGGALLSYADVQALFKADASTSWAAYVAGCLLVLVREKGLKYPTDENISMVVSSEVPEGKGVSSSASLEVATMSALLGAYGVQLEGRELAIICQKVENLVVGAPCGIMDQMASALGQHSQLLALLCQPAEVQGCVPIPPHIAFWGVDSGVRHSVGGSDYTSVRVGAFMGMRIASEAEHKRRGGGGSSEPRPLRSGYLVSVTPSEYMEWLQGELPESMSGAEFKNKYGSHFDSVTSIQDDKTYAIRIPAAHPIQEHFRVSVFRQALLSPVGTPDQLQVLGELMLQSHASYSACALGSARTDRLVELVREHMEAARATGHSPKLYGAKITGGGCGGTVCIMGVAGPDGEAAVQSLVQKYRSETGYNPKVFKGSSAGAAEFGHVIVKLLQ